MQDKEFAAILQEEPMQPLALVPLTEEEQVCTSHTLTNAYLQMLNCLSPILWYLTLIQIQLTDVPVSSHSSHSSLLLFFFFWLVQLTLQRNFSMSVNSVAVLRLMGKGVGGAAPAGVVRGRGATRGGRGNGREKKLDEGHRQ